MCRYMQKFNVTSKTLVKNNQGMFPARFQPAVKHVNTDSSRIRTCGQTPSTASTTTIAPSHSLTAVDTSEEKST